VRYSPPVRDITEDQLAEGAPEKEFNPWIASRLARKRVSAGALIRDSEQRVLTVVPTYKPTWEIPGGMCETNEEPRTTLEREIREELGVQWDIGRLLVVDWVPEHGVWPDAIHFIFDCGQISNRAMNGFTLPTDEISSVQMSPVEELSGRVRPSLARRVSAALNAVSKSQPQYLCFGRPEE